MTETTNIALPAMRVSYEQGSLSESELAATWHEQLQLWLDAATNAGLPEPNAMVLATTDTKGRPSSRT
ncbi:MAG: pyridoxamine 5-phosphate oxidase, partial [Pseudonocardiales bacterium]|nr:pyridoxamine 5-phosphate oxidase [Pseudonocardiales bacterium]